MTRRFSTRMGLTLGLLARRGFRASRKMGGGAGFMRVWLNP
jgi:hypothetical protein